MREETTLYYRNQLNKKDQIIYDTLKSQWGKFENSIKINMPDSDISLITQAVHFDNPLLFYVNFYHIEYSQLAQELYVLGDYLYEKKEARKILDYCRKWGSYIINHKPQNLRNVELALWLHDVIIRNTTYGESNGIRSHSIAGAICDHRAVCEGISMAYKYLCDLAGIPCIYVAGELNGNPHGWNMIWIDNNPSFVDVTNDLNDAGRKNFMRSSKEMIGYSWDNSVIPECRLRNKKNEYFIVHNKRELKKCLRTIRGLECAEIYLDFGRTLDGREIERLIITAGLTNPLLMIHKVSYSVESQMIIIQK